MKTLVAWLEALWALICGIIADLPMAFRTMLRRLHTVLCCVIHRLCAAWKSGGLGGLFPTGIPHVASHAPFIPINHPAWKKPDPMIYDQYYLMSLGLAVSWQNPDIQILRNGVPVASAYDLEPATTYEIVATIWNGSTSGVISGMPVSFSYLSFGVQTKSNYLGYGLGRSRRKRFDALPVSGSHAMDHAGGERAIIAFKSRSPGSTT